MFSCLVWLHQVLNPKPTRKFPEPTPEPRLKSSTMPTKPRQPATQTPDTRPYQALMQPKKPSAQQPGKATTCSKPT